MNEQVLEALTELHINRLFERSKLPAVRALVDQIITSHTHGKSASLLKNIIRSRADVTITFDRNHANNSKEPFCLYLE